MSTKLSALKSKVTSILPLLARRHPAWCDDHFGQQHGTRSIFGQSRRFHTNKRPELSWCLSVDEQVDGTRGPYVSGALFLSNEVIANQVAMMVVSLDDARDFAYDLLRVVSLVEAAA